MSVRRPEHIDPFEAAKQLGIEITRGHLDGAASRLYRNGTRARIRVSNNITLPGRRRFSVAHELGHYILGHTTSHDADEREADSFAIEYLMPEAFVHSYCNGADVSFDRARAIGQAFATSLVAAAFRLVELSPEPCVAVCSVTNVARWVKRSPSFDLPIAPCACEPVSPRAWIVDGEHLELVGHSERIFEPGWSGVLSLLWLPREAARAAASPMTEVRPWRLHSAPLLAPR